MILLHINDETKKERIEKICRGLNQQIMEFNEKDLGKTLGAVLSGDKTVQEIKLPPLYIMPDMIIFSGLADKELDAFLAEYRKAGIPVTKLKAVVTPYNIAMKISDIIEHLEEESRMYGRK
ncbi:MAG: DUF3783 domain-containing protein [Clostridia bacterium]|nr:DUF3783 domain-containing protein [Clostridia bacterium]